MNYENVLKEMLVNIKKDQEHNLFKIMYTIINKIKELSSKEITYLIKHFEKMERFLEINYTRGKRDGAGKIKEIYFNKMHELIIKTFDAEKYIYKIDEKRWKCNNIWIGRDRIEKELNVWPGYIDAIEDFLRYFVKREYELNLKEEKLEEELFEKYYTRYSLSRHAQLDYWRHKNPTNNKNIPTCLTKIKHIKRLDVILPAYIYFLLKNNEIVYIGQTNTAWPGRIENHIKEGKKDFNDVWYLEVDPLSLNKVEKKYINEFKPKYNIRSNHHKNVI